MSKPKWLAGLCLTMGILQIVGFAEEPKGVKIRYKMIQQSQPSGVTTEELPAMSDPDVHIVFEKVSVVIKAPLAREMPQSIEISSDGTCLYRIEERPKRGEQERWPEARLLHKMDKKRLRRLQELLEETKWLTAPGGEGPALHTDADKWTITIVRDGQSRTITCRGRRPEPYRSLMWFFRGLARQENLLYRLGWVPDLSVRREACREIQAAMAALRGDWGRIYPLFDLDYGRYEEDFAQVIEEPFGRADWEIRAAIELLAHLRAKPYADNIAHVLRDRDMHVRTAAARAIADLEHHEAIRVLADIVGSTDEAGWSLIRLGEPAVPTIVEIIERGVRPDDVRSMKLVRVYLDHWRELPGPLDERITTAVRKAIARTSDTSWHNYYEAFLKLAEKEPPLPGELVCRINQGWDVLRSEPVQLIHGWHTVVNGKIVEHGASPTPESGTARFSLLKSHPTIEQGKLKIQTGWLPARPSPGERPSLGVADVRYIGIPPGAELKRVYHAHQKVRLANYVNPVRITREYTTLWEGWVVKDGQPVERLIYVARIAAQGDPNQTFVPPRKPAPSKGELVKAPPPIDFRGIQLNEASKLSDPAVLHDLSVAWLNDAIKAAGGKPRDVSESTVIYKSRLKEASGHHFVVFHDSAANVFYVQAWEGRRIEYHGPFKGDPYGRLNLPKDEQSAPQPTAPTPEPAEKPEEPA